MGIAKTSMRKIVVKLRVCLYQEGYMHLGRTLCNSKHIIKPGNSMALFLLLFCVRFFTFVHYGFNCNTYNNIIQKRIVILPFYIKNQV